MKNTNIMWKELLNGLGFGGISWLMFETLVAFGLRENAAGVVTICIFLGGSISLLENHITRTRSNRMDEK